MEVKAADVQKNVVFVKIIYIQKIAGKFGKPVGFKQDDIQVFLLGLRRDDTVYHGLHISTDTGKRRAEVVGDVGNKLALVLIEFTQFVTNDI